MFLGEQAMQFLSVSRRRIDVFSDAEFARATSSPESNATL
jgi:hypothetical protein